MLSKYIEKIKAFLPKQNEELTKEEQQQKRKELVFRLAIAVMMLAAIISSVTAITGNGIAGRSITVSNSSTGRDLPIYCVQTDKNQISLTFDAAWGNEDTQTILDTLEKHDIRVTFFMTGGWVEDYPDDVKAILAAGHDLANHSENHKNMSQLSNAEIKEELMTVHEKVKELTDYEMNLFRPPYGDYDNDVIKTVAKNGYVTVQWDVDSLVTRIKTVKPAT
jgi:peptidoglycan/xylan/chitin deacetylase (PgdA/CDA1 family)